ncbi:hypothetical protein [uncultured Roseobacter sp.]|uniref:hypothetical protein n=1 Tax=uncultured Roseobacter sp. TaxID=114847 RepID=UPI0026060FA8|nr:hypothetical protein [uncultured Roseobacter sp.]
MTWRALLASGLVCFCAGGLYGWSALIAPLQAAYGVSTAQTGLVFSLAIASFTLSVILTPQLPWQTSTPRAVACFGLLGAVCVFAAARAQGYVPFLLWFSGGFGAASGGIYIAALGVAALTPAHRIATPAMVAAFGTGGAVFGPVWRVMDAHGVGMGGLSVLAAGLLMSSTCAAFAAAPAISEKAQPPAGSSAAHPSEGHSRKNLVVIWAVFAFGSFGGLMVLGLASKMMDAAQTSLTLASLGLAGIAIGNTSGRLSVAFLSSHLRLEQCLFLAMAITLCGLLSAVFHAGPAMLCVALILIATGYGIVASTVPVVTRSVFGAAGFQKRFSFIFTAWGVAGFFAPWAGGAMFDASDSFRLPLLISALAAVFCCLMTWQLGRQMAHDE